MHELKIKLTDGQWDALRDHSETTDLEPADDLVSVWWGRTKALLRYAEKLVKASNGDGKSVQFRAYTPRLLPKEERDKIRDRALRAGIAPRPKPKPAPEKQRKLIKAAVSSEKQEPKKKGRKIKPGKLSYKIDLYDADSVALVKAGHIAEARGTTAAAVLKEVGRSAQGKLVKK